MITITREEAILTAKQWLKLKPIFLDTETTGLDDKAEICELSIIDDEGRILLDTLIKPISPIPPQATSVHGIGNGMVSSSPSFSQIFPQLHELIKDKVVVVYNASYDFRLIYQSARVSGINPTYSSKNAHLAHIERYCAMSLYADFYGEWNDWHGNNKWQSLTNAMCQCGLKVPDNAHRALADARMCKQIVEYMASQGGNDG